MFDWVLFDGEGDGLKPTKFHCLSYVTSKGVRGTVTDYADYRRLFQEYRCFVGHNIIRWDIPNLIRVTGIEIPEQSLCVDTLALSWTLSPLRRGHGLEDIGQDYGIAKPVVHDWSDQPLEVYTNRCQQDVEINLKEWGKQLALLTELYDDPEDLVSYLKYLQFKMECARLQEESGWKLDVDNTRRALNEFVKEREAKLRDLSAVMPKVARWDTKSPPSRMLKADGEPSELAKRWFLFLDGQGLPRDHGEPVDYVVGYDEPNPGSTHQIKDWLTSLGWKPRTFKYVKEKDGSLRAIPQINKEHGAGICDSIVDLYPLCPDLELLDGLSVLSHRIGILSGFLRDEVDGRLAAKIAGLTNTLRFKHSEIVNLPKPEKAYAEPIRASLLADDGDELCGADCASLEDRIKQHFIYDYDPDYVKQLMSPDYDPHLDIAVLAGGMTEVEAAIYKLLDKLHEKDNEQKQKFSILKSIRSIFKNGNYACQYGAGPPRLVITCGIDLAAATGLHEAYWRKNWAIKQVAKDQRVKLISGQMWLLNPISGFWYSLRTKKDIFSTLVQGTASYVFDLWVRIVLRSRPQLTAQFHDEIVLSITKGFRNEATELLNSAMKEANAILGLIRELGIGIQFGSNYAQIH